VSDAQQVVAAESGSQRELEALGYRQELKRGVNTLGHLALILSDITPTASLLVVGTAVVEPWLDDAAGLVEVTLALLDVRDDTRDCTPSAPPTISAVATMVIWSRRAITAVG